MPKSPAFTNVVVVTRKVRTIYVGGQDAVDASGNIVGEGDIGRQTEQVLANLQTALEAGGADLADVVKWNVYIVEGQTLQPGFEAFQRDWGQRPDPPAITVAIVTGLARPELLVEMDAVAVVAEWGEGEMMVQFVTPAPALGETSSAGSARPPRPLTPIKQTAQWETGLRLYFPDPNERSLISL